MTTRFSFPLSSSTGRWFLGTSTLLFCVFLMFFFQSKAFGASAAVRMAYLQNDLHHLPFWVALDQGYFLRYGLEVETAGVFRSGPELMTAFGAGELDAAYVGEAPATIAAVRGTAKVRVLAQANTEGSALVGAARIRTGGGRKLLLAMPGNGSVQDMLLRKALPTIGLSPAEVDTIVLSPPEMLSALQAGDIDGFLAWEPYPSRALALSIGTVLASSADIWAGHPCCVLAVSDALLKERPKQAEALLSAHRAAIRFIHENPEAAIGIAVRHTGMEDAIVRRALGNVTYTETPSVSGEEEYVNFLRRMGFITVDDAETFTRQFIAEEFRRTVGERP